MQWSVNCGKRNDVILVPYRELHGGTRFVSMQNHYNLIYREEKREMLGLCINQGIGVLPWSPLARSRLTRAWEQRENSTRAQSDEFGKTLYDQTEDADRAVVERMGQIEGDRSVSQAQVALAWLLSKSHVTAPIIGATKEQHLEDAANALSLQLTEQEVSRLEEPYIPHAIVGFS